MLSFLTIVVALIATWVAFAQWYLAKSRLKLDLFDRRLAVINALRELIGETLRDFSIETEKLWRFGYDIVGARWLFDDDVEAYLKLVCEKIHVSQAHRRLSEAVPPTPESVIAEKK